MKKLIRNICILGLVLTVFAAVFSRTGFARGGKDLTVLFTHDIHDYLYPTATLENGVLTEHGGAARLATAVRENSDENTLFLDAGDFSMGTLFQAAYSTDAYELRNLGLCGCAVTTFGNHEFDYGAAGTGKMLRAALASGDPLPLIVQSNIDLSGDLTPEQQEFRDAWEAYGIKKHTVLECAGYKIGLFGLAGYDCIECIQTDLAYIDYIEAAKTEAAALEKEGCDLIIALSHAGSSGNGESGEDFDLARQVSGIDLIISGHSHSTYTEPARVGDTLIVSCGEYLKNLGKLTVSKENGKLALKSYSLIPLNSSVPEDPDTKARFEEYKAKIGETYLNGDSFDKIIAHSSFDFISLGEMYSTHQEYPLGDLIADSYLYEARKNGITDIDVALVGLGTVRSSIKKGNITVADAFEICSLGVGADGSAGHPLVSMYVKGRELKLLTELDASLGEMVSSIKMSYSGLSYSFNTKRLILDRVTDLALVDENGESAEIEDQKLYRVVANMYAANMLGMLNGLSKGLLSITPLDKDGNPVTDFYSMSLKDTEGKEIKEWIAFRDYLESFEIGESGYPEIPAEYAGSQDRKIKLSVGGAAALMPGGTATKIMPVLIFSVLAVIVLIVLALVTHRRKKKAQKAARKEKAEAV